MKQSLINIFTNRNENKSAVICEICGNYFQMKTIFKQQGLIFSLAFFVFIFSQCNRKQKEQLAEDEYYVCSMDPQVMEKEAGMCPICKMPLAKATIDKSDNKFIKLSHEQMRLANIKSEKVEIQDISRKKYFTSVFSVNQNKNTTATTRLYGRIEKLYFKIPGETVSQGEPLYDFYSRPLLEIQEEYLLAIEKSKAFGTKNLSSGLIESAKNRLLLYGLTEEQISNLEKTKTPKITNTIYSAVSGTIMEIPMKEGDYANEGMVIYKISDLSTLWVEAQVYPNELSLVKQGETAEIFSPSMPSLKAEGKILFINPEFQPESKISLFRVEIENKDMKFKPGMMAYVGIKKEKNKVLAVPSSSLLRTKDFMMVWVESEPDKFEPKHVTTGIQDEHFTEIISGIKEGEKVVSSGAYLINSEYIFKKGVAPMSGMSHDHSEMQH